jgi:BASS family bile acid:Na+ symporter
LINLRLQILLEITLIYALICEPMNNETLDQFHKVKLDISQDSLFVMNICIAIIMFGVAISINIKDFKEILRNPRGVFAGVTSQFLLFPFVTFLLVWILKPPAGLALGMILVAACPGGNVSNFFSLQSKGNVTLSVSLTVFATLLSPILTPVNFEFWGGQLDYLQPILKTISIDYFDLAKTVLMIMVLPLVLGIWTAYKYPVFVIKIGRPLRILSILILGAFIGFALLKNWDYFAEYYNHIIWLVLIHNALGLGAGLLYGGAITRKLSDSKTISIETGIQNAGLGLVIIVTFFNGQGGMALITAWWGIWDIISGLIIAQVYKRWQRANTSSLA